jgi:hypothetical protein
VFVLLLSYVIRQTFTKCVFCGEKQIEPIHPGKIAHILNEKTAFVSVQDATYEGFYSYPADAINSVCGQVRVEIYSEKNPEKPVVKTLDRQIVERIAEDFRPYLSAKTK